MTIFDYTVWSGIMILSVSVGVLLFKNSLHTIFEKRKRDVTKDERDFLDWMKEIPDIKTEEVIPDPDSVKYTKRWTIELHNFKGSSKPPCILIEDKKSGISITIYESGSIYGGYSKAQNKEHLLMYDFRLTPKFKEFKQTYMLIFTTFTLRKRVNDEKIRITNARKILTKMRTG